MVVMDRQVEDLAQPNQDTKSSNHRKLSHANSSTSISKQRMLSTRLHHRVFGRLHVLSCPKLPDLFPQDPYAYFQVVDEIKRLNYRDPHGPANLLMMYKFCELVDLQTLENPHRCTALCIGEEPESRNQAALLLGAYMIMRHELSPDDAMERLAPVLSSSSASFPYPESAPSAESLPLRDCLRALQRSRDLGWIRFADGGDDGFDPEEYAYFDSPLNADLHELVPARLLVSSCPRALPAAAGWSDRYDAAGAFVARDFSPAHAADHLAQFDAALCVRVGVPRYGRDSLDGTGLALLDLYCEDAPAAPPPAAVAAFLAAAAAAAPRAVALQGDGAAGPAAALAGAYLVRREGFAPREAAAWLRMVRPGCVAAHHLPFLRSQASIAHSAAAPAAPDALARRTASSAVAITSAGSESADAVSELSEDGGLRRGGSLHSIAAAAGPGGGGGSGVAGRAGSWEGMRQWASTGRLGGLLRWAGAWGM
jgi:hypothetical protein